MAIRTFDSKTHRHAWRGIAFAALMAAMFVAQQAHADCPLGSMPDPNYHQTPGTPQRPQRCVPAPKGHSVDYYKGANGPKIEHASTLHSPQPRQMEHKVGPSGPGPIESAHPAGGAADKNSIIFVGGKSALNTQPIPPGKAALNPQPIPPGHALHTAPQPGAPIEKTNGH